MFFRKKKGMIDVRELQRRGVVRIPKSEIVIPTDKDGFVEIGGGQKSAIINNRSPSNSNTEFFGFADTMSSTTSSGKSFSHESDGYNKREVDGKITDLDNKIYKLENRIEVLEKKLNISQSSDTSVGVMGW